MVETTESLFDLGKTSLVLASSYGYDTDKSYQHVQRERERVTETRKFAVKMTLFCRPQALIYIYVLTNFPFGGLLFKDSKRHDTTLKFHTYNIKYKEIEYQGFVNMMNIYVLKNNQR